VGWRALARRVNSSNGTSAGSQIEQVLPKVLPETHSERVSSANAGAFQTAITGYRRFAIGPCKLL